MRSAINHETAGRHRFTTVAAAGSPTTLLDAGVAALRVILAAD